MGRSLSAGAYVALLPTIWSMINQAASSGSDGAMDMDVDDEDDISTRVLGATFDHAIRCGTMSAGKRLATEFAARLYLVSDSLIGCLEKFA